MTPPPWTPTSEPVEIVRRHRWLAQERVETAIARMRTPLSGEDRSEAVAEYLVAVNRRAAIDELWNAIYRATQEVS